MNRTLSRTDQVPSKTWLLLTFLVLFTKTAHAENELALIQAIESKDAETAIQIIHGNPMIDYKFLIPNSVHKDNIFTFAAWFGDAKIVQAIIAATHDNGDRYTNSIGRTPLFIASSLDHSEAIKTLLTANADPRKQAKDGATPLFIATQENHLDAMNTLCEAKTKGDRSSVALVDLPLKDGTTPLHEAAGEGRTDLAAALIQHGANVNSAKKDGSTPLLMAIGYRHKGMVDLLLESGADVNAVMADGTSALLLAAGDHDFELAEKLLKHGASPNLAQKDGTTPLLKALREGQKDLALKILKSNPPPNPNVADSEGVTPLIAAAYQGYSGIAEILLKQGAKIDHISATWGTALSASLRFPNGLTTSLLIKQGALPRTPYVAALLSKDSAQAELLLKDGNLNFKDEIAAALSFGQKDQAKKLLARFHQLDTTDRSTLESYLEALGCEADATLCLICLETAGNPTRNNMTPNGVSITPCGHTFCQPCLKTWSKKTKERETTLCPNCKQGIQNEIFSFSPQVSSTSPVKSRTLRSVFNSMLGIGKPGNAPVPAAVGAQ